MPVMRIINSWPIRKKLLTLLLLIFLPASALTILSSLDHRNDAILEAKRNALMLVESLAAQQEQVAIGAIQMLRTLAQFRMVQKLDASSCDELFRELNNRNPSYSTIAAATPDGRMFAGSAPFTSEGADLSHQKQVMNAIRTLDFSTGESILGKVGKVQSLNYIYPVVDNRKNFVAVVMAGFRLDEFARFVEKVKLPQGSALTILDPDGVRLYRVPDNDAAAPGTPVASEVLEFMSGDSHSGIFERIGADGISRIYAFKRMHLPKNSHPYLYMTIGLPKDKILNDANTEMLLTLAILWITALSAMFAAWLFGNFLFVGPINKLVNAAWLFGNEGLGTRTGLPHTADEIGQLARSFDEMVELLETKNVERERVQVELRKANEELDAKVAERTSELASANDKLKAEVSERGKIEDALHASLTYVQNEKSRTESIIAGLSDGLTILDRNFKITYQNEISKITMGSHTEKHCYLAFHGLNKPCEGCLAALCFSDGEIHGKEVSTNNDGKVIYLEIAVSPLRNATGEIVGAIELARDITLRKRAEFALKQSEAKYRTLFESATSAILLLSDNVFIDGNEAAQKMFGCTREELIGSQPFDFSPPFQPEGKPSREEGEKRLADVLAGHPQSFDWQHRRSDGTCFDAEVILNRIKIDSEPLILAIVWDLTARKQSERALQESALFQQQLIDALPLPVFYKDLDCRYLGCNKAFETFTRKGKEEIIGKSSFEIAPLELATAYYEKDIALLENPGVQVYESFSRDADERLLDVVFHKATFSNADGSVRGLIGAVLDMTGRKRAEEELKESERLLHSIIQGYPIAAFVIGKDHQVIYWNKALEEMSQIKAAEVAGTKGHWRAFYGTAALCMADLLVDEATPEAISNRYEGKSRKSAFLEDAYEGIDFFVEVGGGKWLHFTAAPIRNSQGSIIGAIETVEDITERKMAEEALKESRQLLSDMIDFLPDATFVIDRNGEVIAWNRAIEEMTGIRSADMLGKGNHEYALPFYGERRALLIDLVFESGQEIEHQYEAVARTDRGVAGEAYMPASGGGVYLLGKASALFDSKGNVVGAIESIRDITERKLMEKTVAEAEAKYRGIFENALMGIFQTTPEGRFINLNKAHARILGYDSPEEVIKAVSDISRQLFVKPEQRQEMLRLIEEHGMVHEFEAQFFKKNKSTVWITLNVRAVRDRNGNISHLEGIAQDITERKYLQAQLNQAQKIEAIGTLAGGIAHDFNNILAPIIGYSEITLGSVSKDSRIHHNLAQILLSANRARELVKQILTFSHGTEQECKPVKVSILVKETLKLLRSSLPSTIVIHQDLDDYAMDSTVMADPTQIHRVLMNLCTNSAHAMREKGGMLSVTLANADIESGAHLGLLDLGPGAYLKLTVADTGHGMNEEVKKRVFDPYFTTKGPSEGTGLGLAVVYGIIKNLSGGIAVSSEPAAGTTFDIYFPRTEVFQASVSEMPESLPTGEGHILLVDDEKPIVDMMGDMLVNLGYEVARRYSGSDALEAFQAHPERFDLVITDLTMPHITGIDLAREIQKVRADLPIILCTGFSEGVDEDRTKKLGISGFLMKPVAMRDMADSVSKILVEKKNMASYQRQRNEVI